MATGTTLTINTNPGVASSVAAVATDAGTPTLGSPTFIFDDGETQSALIKALEDAKDWVVRNVTKV